MRYVLLELKTPVAALGVPFAGTQAALGQGWRAYQATVVGDPGEFAKVRIEVSNDEVAWITHHTEKTITVQAGDAFATDRWAADEESWAFARAVCTELSEAGQLVVTLGH